MKLPQMSIVQAQAAVRTGLSSTSLLSSEQQQTSCYLGQLLAHRSHWQVAYFMDDNVLL